MGRKWMMSVLVGAVLGLVACQAAAPGEEDDQPVVSPPALVRPTGSQTAAGGRSGLFGVVKSASDVSGQPDEPLADQLVLAVPFDQAGAVLGVTQEQLVPETLRFLKAELSAAGPGLYTTYSGPDGAYRLDLAPGRVVLCLADGQGSPPGFPAVTRGCGLVDVPAGEPRQVDISSGFGEILLIE